MYCEAIALMEIIMDGKCPFSGEPCDNFKNVHIKQNNNGKISEQHCCQECGSKFLSPLSFALIPVGIMNMIPGGFSTLMNNYNKLTTMNESNQLRCKCNSSLEDIKRVGRLGCAECYGTFKNELITLLPRMHSGNLQHYGKKPKNNIEMLKKKMALAVAEEKYEEAAIFRDRIKALNEQPLQRNDLEPPNQGIEENVV
jgi:protein arginine kinase activator